jgi:hypothetical protein
MIVLLALVVGGALGAWRAKARGGNRLDMLQWGGVHAILFALAGLILTIVITRLL